jgi:hypothetical protein
MGARIDPPSPRVRGEGVSEGQPGAYLPAHAVTAMIEMGATPGRVWQREFAFATAAALVGLVIALRGPDTLSTNPRGPEGWQRPYPIS